MDSLPIRLRNGRFGTVMHGTRTPLRLWYRAAYLVATHTPGISAVQLQRQLAIGRYETAWLILQKLRRAMVAPEHEPLKGEVEVDETFVGGRNSQRRAAATAPAKTLVGVACLGSAPSTPPPLTTKSPPKSGAT
jgi:hypothetical protein